MYLSSIFALLRPGRVTNSSICIGSRHVFAWTTHRCSWAIISSSLLGRRSAVVTNVAPSRFRLLSTHLLTLRGVLTVSGVNTVILSGVIFEAYLRSTRRLLGVHHVGIVRLVILAGVLRELLRIRNVVIFPVKIWNDIHGSWGHNIFIRFNLLLDSFSQLLFLKIPGHHLRFLSAMANLGRFGLSCIIILLRLNCVNIGLLLWSWILIWCLKVLGLFLHWLQSIPMCLKSLSMAISVDICRKTVLRVGVLLFDDLCHLDGWIGSLGSLFGLMSLHRLPRFSLTKNLFLGLQEFQHFIDGDSVFSNVHSFVSEEDLFPNFLVNLHSFLGK